MLFVRPLFRVRGIHPLRSFSTSKLLFQKTFPTADVVADAIPPYPYPTQWYKQSSRGLYAGQTIKFGNNVSGKFKYKTRRAWRPNVFSKRLWSRGLNCHVRVKCSVKALRTIEKNGGLDEYLLGIKEGRVKALGEMGWLLRWAILRTEGVRRKFEIERRGLGLPDKRDVGGEGVKVRVARGRYLVLTKDGWRRVRPKREAAAPSVEVFEEVFREKMAKRQDAIRIEMEGLKGNETERMRLEKMLLTPKEEKEALRLAKREWRKRVVEKEQQQENQKHRKGGLQSV
ncbi:hypothetical protein K470DRAFT_259920 [Piedraia hortae CBS 480.64]|uniref:Large ribosomal subunit protein bL28m n=1 Tax=Piedraia hortae CBS 480.64 TaxID=1314780 RepID=A0A6A7BUC4_9PEZI|nr:hypothetical protein K470DRAFT_259920 [Piedraia hortae CBS 480.64]